MLKSGKRLGGRLLRNDFVGLGAVLGIAGDLEIDLVAFNGAVELLNHRVAVEFALHFEGDVVAVNLPLVISDGGGGLSPPRPPMGTWPVMLSPVCLRVMVTGRPGPPPRR